MTILATMYLNNNDARNALLFAYYYRYGFFFFNAGLHTDSRIGTLSGLALCVQLARDIIVSLDIDYRSFLL